MSLPLDKIVQVSDKIEPSGVLRKIFGIGLFITIDKTLGTGTNRISIFQNFDEIANKFSSSSEPYKAGQAWFSQTPRPKALIVGRFYNEPTCASIVGGKVSKLVNYFAALTDASFKLTVKGQEYTVSADLTGSTSYEDIALKIKNAISVAGSTVGFTYSALNHGFILVTNETGIEATLQPWTDTMGGTSIAGDLGMTKDRIVQQSNGVNSEDLVEAILAIKALNSSFYFVTLDNLITDENQTSELFEYVETGRMMGSYLCLDKRAITPSEDITLAADFHDRQLERVWTTFSYVSEYKNLACAAIQSAVDFDSPDSMVTLNLQTLVGMKPDVLSEDDVSELERKRINYYTNISIDSDYLSGTACRNGVWVEIRYALDWFVNACQVSIYNLLKGSGRIPQTDDGEGVITNAIINVCKQAKYNGFVSGGKVSEAMITEIKQVTRNNDFDGVLHEGYLVWSQPSSEQNASDRASRKATSKKIWLKAAGAIHTAELTITLEN